MNLVIELLVMAKEGIILGLELLELSFEQLIVLLQLFGLPPGPPVLKPDGNLPRLKAEILGQPQLPLCLQLIPPGRSSSPVSSLAPRSVSSSSP
ncbi:hypothetical protein HPP92_027881 [Vanilla planifolia]|nr:hypothetical protein HPP92_027881 [Vanilla planifolia]